MGGHLTFWRANRFSSRNPVGLIHFIIYVAILVSFFAHPIYVAKASECLPLGSVNDPANRFQRLIDGGYLIILRHAKKGTPVDRLCKEPDKGITKLGMGDANLAGELLNRRGVPIANIYSSEYCRTIQTAESIRDGYSDASAGPARSIPIKEMPSLNISSNKKWLEKAFRSLKSEMSKDADRALGRSNTVAVTHSSNLNRCLPAGIKVGFLEAVFLDLDCTFRCPFRMDSPLVRLDTQASWSELLGPK